jgi:hypothetical protein
MMLWLLVGLTVLAGVLVVWAWLTGRPARITGVHRMDGETRPLEWWADDDQIQRIHGPTRRWYDENPWLGDPD